MSLTTYVNAAERFPCETRANDSPRDTLVVDLVQCIGDDDFSQSVIDAVSRHIPIGSWCTYVLSRNAPPQLLAGATQSRPDVSCTCWQAYRDGLYRSDTSFDTARASAGRDSCAITHITAEDLPARHRSEIYERHGLQERLSVVAATGAEAVMTINFYRFGGQPRFGMAEANLIRQVAPAFFAAVRRHVAITANVAAPADGKIASEAAIRNYCPRLTDREIEVCVGLLHGWTFDGIAAHLNVAPATVKTYRDRAFRRLGIRHRNELFKLYLAASDHHL